MNKLFIERIKVISTNLIIYEFVFENIDEAKKYRGIDEFYQYPFKVFASELFNLIDNQTYSNRIFNEWKIKLYKDITLKNDLEIKKDFETFVILNIINDLKGNIIFKIVDNNITLYYKKVKLADFKLMINNIIDFNEQPIEKYNIYSIDKFYR